MAHPQRKNVNNQEYPMDDIKPHAPDEDADLLKRHPMEWRTTRDGALELAPVELRSPMGQPPSLELQVQFRCVVVVVDADVAAR